MAVSNHGGRVTGVILGILLSWYSKKQLTNHSWLLMKPKSRNNDDSNIPIEAESLTMRLRMSVGSHLGW